MDLTINQFNSNLDFNVFNTSEGKSGFRIFYNNIRSLKNKIDNIELLVNNYETDLIILTETWITKMENQFFYFSNYNSIYSYRNRQGGWIGLFLHSSFDYNIIEVYESENHGCIIIKIENFKLIIVAVYRPPSYNVNDFLLFLDEKINSILAFNYKCIVIGDMNIDILNNNLNRERIIDVYNSNNFNLCNCDFATRHSENNHSLIDHIAINFKDKIKLSIISNCLSDHDIQILDINLKSKDKQKKRYNSGNNF